MGLEQEGKKRMRQAAGEGAGPQSDWAGGSHIPNSAALAMMGGDSPSGGAGLGDRILARMSREDKRPKSKSMDRADQWYRDLEDQLGKKGIKHILKGTGKTSENKVFQKAVEQLQDEGGDLSKQTLKMLKKGGEDAARFAAQYRDLQKRTRGEREKSTFRYEKDTAKLDKREKLLRKEMARREAGLDEKDSGKDRKRLEKLAREQEKLDRKRTKYEERYARTMDDPKEAKRFLKEKQWEREKARKDRR